MEQGTLEDLLKSKERYQQLSPTSNVKIAVGILLAMKHAHAEGVTHGNLNPSNVFLCAQDEVKVGGFAWSYPETNGARLPAVFLSSRNRQYDCYRAPETKNNGPCTERSDVYSFGQIFAALVTGKGIPDDRTAFTSDGLSTSADSVLAICVEPEPGDRGTFADIQKHMAENKYDILDDSANIDQSQIEDYISRVGGSRAIDEQGKSSS